MIDQPWSRATPPSADVGAGYFRIVNTGAAPDRLLGGTTDVAERLEFHTSEIVDGIARMRPATEGIAIAPNSAVVLEPGGTHAMLVALKSPLKEGATIRATLTFEVAGSVDVEFKVEGMAYRPPKAAAPASMHGSEHGASP